MSVSSYSNAYEFEMICLRGLSDLSSIYEGLLQQHVNGPLYPWWYVKGCTKKQLHAGAEDSCIFTVYFNLISFSNEDSESVCTYLSNIFELLIGKQLIPVVPIAIVLEISGAVWEYDSYHDNKRRLVLGIIHVCVALSPNFDLRLTRLLDCSRFISSDVGPSWVMLDIAAWKHLEMLRITISHPELNAKFNTALLDLLLGPSTFLSKLPGLKVFTLKTCPHGCNFNPSYSAFCRCQYGGGLNPLAYHHRRYDYKNKLYISAARSVFHAERRAQCTRMLVSNPHLLLLHVLSAEDAIDVEFDISNLFHHRFLRDSLWLPSTDARFSPEMRVLIRASFFCGSIFASEREIGHISDQIWLYIFSFYTTADDHRFPEGSTFFKRDMGYRVPTQALF